MSRYRLRQWQSFRRKGRESESSKHERERTGLSTTAPTSGRGLQLASNTDEVSLVDAIGGLTAAYSSVSRLACSRRENMRVTRIHAKVFTC